MKKIIILLIIPIFFTACQTKKVMEKQSENILSVDALNEDNDLVFPFSIEDYIDSFNSICDSHITLADTYKWRFAEYEDSFYSANPTYLYSYTAEKNNWSLPGISVYTSAKSGYVREIILEFDDHSYTEEMYELYEEYCFYTLKTLLPHLSDERIKALYKEANKNAYDGIFTSDKWYGKGAIPRVMYCHNEVGIYPYFAIGQHLKMCIIPISEQLILDFENKGVEINEI